MTKRFRLLLLVALAGLLTGGAVLARATQQGENCSVPAGETVRGSLFAFCQNLDIAGKIEGNLIGIGLRTTITGDIGENVYLIGLELDLIGTVRGDAHFLGLMLELASPDSASHSPVLGQLIFAALSFTLDAGAQVSGPIIGFGYQALLNGEVHGEVSYWGSAFVLDNLLRGDLYTTVGNPESDVSDVETLLLPLGIEFTAAAPGLTITGKGNISGDLAYVGPVEAMIEGNVSGAVEHYSTVPVFIPELPQQGLATLFYDRFTRELTVLLTVGILGIALAGRRFRYPLTHLRRRPAHSFVIGMLLFIISFPITLILLVTTLFIILFLLALNLDGAALPVGAFLALVDIAVIGGFYFCAIFIARAVFALGLGRLVMQVATGGASARRRPRLSIIIGVALLALLTSLPVFGFLFNASALFLGLGAIASTITAWLQAMRSGRFGRISRLEQDQRSSEDHRQTVPKEPTPRADGRPLLPGDLGFDDLPDGFDPDFFFSDD
ncbi:MAG: hypothetical protein OXG78_03930 [Chloroflexi bacterium]|nr:hypothetical protein [Chloroflexota bacterium]